MPTSAPANPDEVLPKRPLARVATHLWAPHSPMFSDKDFINATLRKCAALQEAGLWCPSPSLRPRAWLHNFEENDRVLAAVILDNFAFYSDRQSDLLFKAAFEDALADFARESDERRERFLSDAIFTPVEGETPNPTDSGYSFCRRARQVLGVPEARIVRPAKALELAREGAPVVFVDDIIGSGEQLIKTWSRSYAPSPPSSFAAAHGAGGLDAAYISLVATSYGLKRIAQAKVPVSVFAAHVLSERHSVTQVEYKQLAPSIPDLRGALLQMLRAYSGELVVPDYMQDPGSRSLGFHDLGLLVGFEHSIPDATIPLIWAESSGANWVPLRKRS